MNCTAPEMIPDLSLQSIFFFFFLMKALPRGTLIAAAIIKATGKLRQEGRARTGVGIKGNPFGVEGKYIGDHFGVDISFRRLYKYIYLQSSYRNKRAKGYQF